MDKQQFIEQTITDLRQAVQSFGEQHSALRLTIETPYTWQKWAFNKDTNSFELVEEKAVITVMGKRERVPIGDTHPHKTYGEAYEATRKKWSAYYARYRENMTPEQKLRHQRAQRRYQALKRAGTNDFDIADRKD